MLLHPKTRARGKGLDTRNLDRCAMGEVRARRPPATRHVSGGWGTDGRNPAPKKLMVSRWNGSTAFFPSYKGFGLRSGRERFSEPSNNLSC